MFLIANQWVTKTSILTRRNAYAVTCIQFNPVDDRYFISGSLDAKVRLWSIPDRQVVDWTDINEMVTAASYTPDGQVRPITKHLSIGLYQHFTSNLAHLHI